MSRMHPVAMEGKLDSPPCVLDTGIPCRYDDACGFVPKSKARHSGRDCRTNRQDSRFARLRRPKGEGHGCPSCIQSPWRAMHRLRYALSDAIDCPEFHLPVFWIPAFPAGMTCLQVRSNVKGPSFRQGLPESRCHGGQCIACVMPFQMPSIARSFTSLCSGYRHSLPV